MTPCSLVQVHLCFGGICCLHLQDWSVSLASKNYLMPTFLLISCLGLLFNPEDATCTNFYWMSHLHISEVSDLHSEHSEDLKSSKISVVFVCLTTSLGYIGGNQPVELCRWIIVYNSWIYELVMLWLGKSLGQPVYIL
jgi:hypothetical protein